MAPAAATEPLTLLFGFAQYDFAGALAVADGRYLTRDEAGEDESVLVVEGLAAHPAQSRRRRRPQPVEAGERPFDLPLTRVTAVRAAEPLANPEEAESWLTASTEDEQLVDEIVEAGIAVVNRALFAQGAAAADPHFRELTPLDAVVVRVGYGSGEEVAVGRYAAARHVDVSVTRASRRRQRTEELRPQERVAAVLGGRERVDACEAPLLRARADLAANRMREAALQLRIALDALLVELRGAVADPGHEEDMGELAARREAIARDAAAAAQGDLDEDARRRVADAIEICERVLRRRRVLRGG